MDLIIISIFYIDNPNKHFDDIIHLLAYSINAGNSSLSTCYSKISEVFLDESENE